MGLSTKGPITPYRGSWAESVARKFTIEGRRQVEVNTDPQRRCYNGCHFSSEWIWTDWYELGYVATQEEAEKAIANWKCINPKNEYRFLPPNHKVNDHE